MFRRSINTIMVGVISFIVFIAIGSLVIYVTNSSKNMVLELQENSLKEIANSITKVCEDFFEDAVLEVETLAHEKEMLHALQGGSIEEARLIFEETIKASKGKIAVAILFNMQGEIVTGSNINGNALTKEHSGDKKYSAGIVDGKDVFISPYLLKSKKLNKLLGSIGAAVKDTSGKIIGGVAILPNFDALFDRYVLPLHFGKHGYAFILDDKGRILAHQDKELILKDLSNLDFAKYALAHKNGTLDYLFKGLDKFLVFREVPSTHWVVCLNAVHTELAAGAIHQRNVLMGVGTGVILTLILAILFISRRLIFEPLSHILSFVSKVAEGDYKAELEGKFQYELVELADNIKAMVMEIKNKIGFSEGILQAIALPYVVADEDDKIIAVNKRFVTLLGHSGTPKDAVGQSVGEYVYNDSTRLSLTNKAVKARKPFVALEGKLPTQQGTEVDILADAAPIYDLDGNLLAGFGMFADLTEIKTQQRLIEEQNKKIAVTAEEAFGVAEQLAGASEELATQIEQSSGGADTQRERVHETATAMEQMNATVLEVAKNASGAAEGAATAKTKAEEGQEIVQSVIKAITLVQDQAQHLKSTMEALGSQAEDIGNVMNVISDIADQTNLLALNAAIEAARAGDAGRGFAVVADEVRKLAEKTVGATQEVGTAITSIQQGTRGAAEDMDKAVNAVEEATSLAGQSGEALSEIVGLVDKASDQVGSIATASEEQSATSEEINRAIDEISKVSTETADAMEQSSQAIADLAELAQTLNALIQDLQDS